MFSLKSSLYTQKGQGLVEYIALTALIAIVSISTLKLLGGKVKTRLNQVTNTFDRNVQSGLRGLEDSPQPPTPRKSSKRFPFPF